MNKIPHGAVKSIYQYTKAGGKTQFPALRQMQIYFEPRNQSMKYEKSCGAICYTYDETGAPRVLVICHRYGGHWAFPKGHVEAGESEEQTAVREVREETGVQVCVRPGYREVTTYSPAKGVTKDVVFFVARITGGTLCAQPEEVRTVCLLSLDDALRRLTYAADRELLEKAKNMILSEKPVDNADKI